VEIWFSEPKERQSRYYCCLDWFEKLFGFLPAVNRATEVVITATESEKGLWIKMGETHFNVFEHHPRDPEANVLVTLPGWEWEKIFGFPFAPGEIKQILFEMRGEYGW